MPPRSQVLDDDPLKGCALRQFVERGCDTPEDETYNVLVAFATTRNELKTPLETHDIGMGRQIVGELWVEQPGCAPRKAIRLFREVAAEEIARIAKRRVADRGLQWSARFRDMYGESRIARERPRSRHNVIGGIIGDRPAGGDPPPLEL